MCAAAESSTEKNQQTIGARCASADLSSNENPMGNGQPSRAQQAAEKSAFSAVFLVNTGRKIRKLKQLTLIFPVFGRWLFALVVCLSG